MFKLFKLYTTFDLRTHIEFFSRGMSGSHRQAHTEKNSRTYSTTWKMAYNLNNLNMSLATH